MKVSILKTREGQRPKKFIEFDTIKEAQNYLKGHWRTYKDMWGKSNYWEGFSNEGKVLKYDVYKFEIVKEYE